MRVGFVGLGSIGAPMAERILTAGHDLGVWNRTPSKTEWFAELGAYVARNPSELADRSDVICLCVTDAAALDAVVFGPEGIASASRTPPHLADHSTIPPSETRRLADRLARQAGSMWIDAPVSGGISGARAGTLAIFAGGPADAVEVVRPVFECFASNVTHMGPVGSGQIAKACNQIIGFLSFAALAEALALGDRQGIDTSRLARAFEGGFADTPVLREWQRALTQDKKLLGPALHVEAFRTHLLGQRNGPDYSGPSPTNLFKDLEIIRDLAEEAQCNLPLVERMAAFVEQVRTKQPEQGKS